MPQQGSEREFDELREQASAVLELDSEPGTATSYVSLALTIVRQCDILLAIWDGGKSNGPGGTADVVLEPLRANIPVICIDARRQNGHAISFIELTKGEIEWVDWSSAALTEKLRTVFILPPRSEPDEILIDHTRH